MINWKTKTEVKRTPLSNLRALEGKSQGFPIIYNASMTTKRKTDSEFSRASFGEIP